MKPAERGSLAMPVFVSLGMSMHWGIGIAAGLKYGFWWGVGYGAVAESWLFYRLAEWILR